MNKRYIQFISLTPEELGDLISQKIVPELYSKLSKQFQPKEPEEYLSIEQVCELLNKDRTTIWRWTYKSKILTAYQLAGSPYYRRSEIEQILSQNKVN